MTSDQLNQILAAIHEHSALETLSWVGSVAVAIAAIVTAGAAIYALIFARGQISAAKAGTKATFLVDLDRRWEGSEMKDARAKWLTMRELITTTVNEKHVNLTTSQKRPKMMEECSLYLHNLRRRNPNEYNDIISILGFFETIGYIADRGFISADEIVDLYGESIIEFDRLCWDHIQKRLEENKNATGMPTKLWEHACRLIVHARKVYESNG